MSDVKENNVNKKIVWKDYDWEMLSFYWHKLIGLLHNVFCTSDDLDFVMNKINDIISDHFVVVELF